MGQAQRRGRFGQGYSKSAEKRRVIRATEGQSQKQKPPSVTVREFLSDARQAGFLRVSVPDIATRTSAALPLLKTALGKASRFFASIKGKCKDALGPSELTPQPSPLLALGRSPRARSIAASIHPLTGRLCAPGIYDLEAAVCVRSPSCSMPQAGFFGQGFKTALKNGVALSLGVLKSARIKPVILKFGVAAALATLFVAGPFVAKKAASPVPAPQPKVIALDQKQEKAIENLPFLKAALDAPAEKLPEAQNVEVLQAADKAPEASEPLLAQVEPKAETLFASPKSSLVEVIEVPRMPKMLDNLMSWESFARLPKPLQDSALQIAQVKKPSPQRLMQLYSNMAYHLLNKQPNGATAIDKKAVALLWREAATVGAENNLAGSELGKKIFANLSYIYRVGIGTPRNLTNATLCAFLGNGTKVGEQALRALQAKHPDVVRRMAERFPDIRLVSSAMAG